MKFLFALKSRYNIHTHILGVFVVIMIIKTALTLVYGYSESAEANTKLGEDFTRSVQRSLIQNINTIFKQIQVFSNFGGQAFNSGEEVTPNNMMLVGLMREILRNYPHILFINACSKEGKFLHMHRASSEYSFYSDPDKKIPDDTKYIIRYANHSTGKPTETWIYEDGNRKILAKENITNAEFDCRDQDWYRVAARKNAAIWIDVHNFVTYPSKEQGVSFSQAVCDDHTGEFIGVFNVGVSIDDLCLLLSKEKIGKNGSIFIVNKRNELIAYSDISIFPRNEKGTIQITSVKNTQDSKLREAIGIYDAERNNINSFERHGEKFVATFFNSQRESSIPEKNGKLHIDIFNFINNGNVFTCTISDFPQINSKDAYGDIEIDTLSKDWKIGMIVEENEFVGNAKELQERVLFMGLVILVFSTIIMGFVARRISKPIIILAEEANKIKNFDLTGTNVVKSSIYELKLLNEAVISMRQNIKSFSKFVPKDLVGKLLKNNQNIKVGGKNQYTTLLFTDIADFTSISESYPADKLAAHLSEYFEELTKIIFLYNGNIDKYIGDGIMAFWGAPNKDKDQALNACKAALSIQKRLTDLNRQWAAEDKPIFTTRIGIHVGEAIVGNIGSNDRMNYTAIGNTVNLASRLEGANKFYKTNIIISESILKEAGFTKCLARPLDVVAVKGKNEGVEIYELIGINHGEPSLLPSKDRVAFSALFTKAFQLYKQRRWDEAIAAFQSIKLKNGEEYTVSMYLIRCKEFKKHPPSENWNCVTVLKEK